MDYIKWDCTAQEQLCIGTDDTPQLAKENWKSVACTDGSQFMLQHSEGAVRIGNKQHDPSCLVLTVLWCDGYCLWAP